MIFVGDVVTIRTSRRADVGKQVRFMRYGRVFYGEVLHRERVTYTKSRLDVIVTGQAKKSVSL